MLIETEVNEIEASFFFPSRLDEHEKNIIILFKIKDIQNTCIENDCYLVVSAK